MWQENEISLCLKQFDDFKGDAMPFDGLRAALAGMALVDPGNLNTAASDGLDRPGEGFDLAAILRACRREVEREQMAERADRHVKLGALLAFGPIIAGRAPRSSLDRKVRPSMISALGSAERPAASRYSARKSSTSASKHPDTSQRCIC